MDAVMLSEASLGDELGMSVRTSGLVPPRHGHEAEADRRRCRVRGRGLPWLRAAAQFLVATDGAILAEGAVSGSGMLGSSVIEAPNVRRVVEQSCAFALGAWTHIDHRDEIREVVATVAIPDASMKVYSDTEFTGSSLSMGSMFGSPAVVVAPDPPRVARREDVGSPELVTHLVAEVRHAFLLDGRAR